MYGPTMGDVPAMGPEFKELPTGRDNTPLHTTLYKATSYHMDVKTFAPSGKARQLGNVLGHNAFILGTSPS